MIFGVQVVVCQWWSRRFRFGPVEWVWRSLTYLELAADEPPETVPKALTRGARTSQNVAIDFGLPEVSDATSAVETGLRMTIAAQPPVPSIA